jgi:molecular chaperone GrpE
MENDPAIPADAPEGAASDTPPPQAGGFETRPYAGEGRELAPEEQLAKAKEDAQKYLANWQRAEADFSNYKKRTEQERDELRRFGNVSLIINLLPVIDDFERAFGSLDANLAGLSWFDGIILIYRKLQQLLENAGVRPIEADGEAFDPRLHEAVAHVDGDEGKVVSVVQRGYKMHDRVLRPAMVVVGKGSEKMTDDSGQMTEGGNES